MRVAILGLGFMGTTHAAALRGIEGVELAAVCSNRAPQHCGIRAQGNTGAAAAGVDLSGIPYHREVEAVLADPAIDAVDICLPTHLHADVAVEALEAGKHVLVEKPMALDGHSADRMLAAARKNRRVLMVAHVVRFFPAYKALDDAIREGQLGLVRSAVFRRRCAAPTWAGWLTDASKSGGGVFDLLIHEIDLCLHLFGKPEALSATGYENLASGIDCINVQLFYSNGGVALIAGGWHHPQSFPLSMEYTVLADRGTLEYSSLGRPATLYRLDGTEEVLPQPEGNPYAAQIGYFIDCCRTGRQPERCRPEDSADAVRIARLMVEARNRNGERVACDI